MKTSFLSRFTPSMLPPETLEAMFVQRHDLAKNLVEGIRDSALTDNKHHYLIIGPRGIGKTHLVALVHHRIKAMEDLQDKLLIAWLREEEWGVASYLDFLLVIVRTLIETYASPELKKQFDAIHELRDPKAAKQQAEKLLLDTVGDKTLLIIAENMDEIFRGLEDEGQSDLRALIHNHPRFTILGAAQSLFNGVIERNDPFFGFFEAHQLEELSMEEAISLVSKIAEQAGDADLVKMLRASVGHARIRAVHHLAAGNPRVYVIFAQFLTSEGLDQLVQPLLKTLDDLTPYYQSRMAFLTPQQRKIVEHLVENRGYVQVKQLAEGTFIAPNTLTAQLKRLLELGYVRVESRGRESYYELREPLLRLTLEVKKFHAEPLRVIVEFLRMWYSRTELTQRLASLSVEAVTAREYLTTTLNLLDRDPGWSICKIIQIDLERHLATGDLGKALEAAQDQLAVEKENPESWLACARVYLDRNELGNVIFCCNKALQRDATCWPARCLRGGVLQISGDHEGAIADFMKLADEPNLPANLRYGTAYLRAESYRHRDGEGDIERGIADYTSAIEYSEIPIFVMLQALVSRSGLYLLRRHEGDCERAIADCNTVIHNPESSAELIAKARLARGSAYLWGGKEGDEDRALNEFTAVIDDSTSPTDVKAGCLFGRGLTYEKRDGQGDWERAFADLNAANKEPEAGKEIKALSLMDMGSLLISQGRLDSALKYFEQSQGYTQFSSEQEGQYGDALHLAGRQEQAIAAYDRATALSDELTLRRDIHRANAVMASGRWNIGLSAMEKAIRDANPEIRNEVEVGIARHLLLRTRDIDEWRRYVRAYLDVFGRYELLGKLGVDLVHSVRFLRTAKYPAKDIRAWRDVWHELAGERKDMAISLRMLDAAATYLIDADDRDLLRLASEERAIVEPLLGIHHSPTRSEA